MLYLSWIYNGTVAKGVYFLPAHFKMQVAMNAIDHSQSPWM